MSDTELLNWLGADYAHVLEYNGDKAYIQDEDTEWEAPQTVPAAQVQRLIDRGMLAIWRDIGQWNDGYNTYKPTQWVKEWQEHHP